MPPMNKKILSEDAATKILGEVTELYYDAVSAFRAKRLDRAIENAAMYRGWHEVVRDGSFNVSVTDPQGEANESLPLSRMLVKAAVAHKLRNVPNIEIPAAKNDPRSRARAEAAEKLSVTILRTKLNQDELHRAASWAEQTGAAWVKSFWNKTAGRPLPSDFDGLSEEELKAREEDDGFGGKYLSSIYEGDIDYEFVPTTDGFPDPSARSQREIHHFFHIKLLPIYKLNDLFPTDYFGNPTKERWSIGSYTQERRAFEALGDQGGVWESASNTHSSSANTLGELIEFWEMPTRDFPKGRFVAFSDTMILAMGPNPLFPVRIPFILIPGDNLIPGSLYSDGLLEDVRTLQVSTNRTLNKMREWVDKMLNAHLLVPFQAGIDKNLWGDKPGQIINYQKGYRPEALHPPEIPNSMFSYLNEQIERAKMVTGYSDVGRGDLPSNISGRSVAFATENEQAMREPNTASYRRAVLTLVQHGLWLIRQFYDDGRMVQMVGENGKTELIEFLEDNFDWDNDLVPEIYSGRPNSHTARVSEVLEFHQAGLFEDGPAFERARRMLGGDYANMATFDPFSEDRARSRREQLTFLRGQPLAMRFYDTHRIHLEEHNKFRRSLEFEELPPQMQDQFNAHCESHELAGIGAGQLSDDLLNAGGGMNAPPGQQQQPQQPGELANPLESPPNGGSPGTPAPAPSISEFASMDDPTQRASDQL